METGVMQKYQASAVRTVTHLVKHRFSLLKAAWQAATPCKHELNCYVFLAVATWFVTGCWQQNKAFVPHAAILFDYSCRLAVASKLSMIKRKTLTLAASQQEPATQPPEQRARVNSDPVTVHDATVESKLKLPNERDESVAMTPAKPDPVIRQAAVDLEHGLQDTSKALETDQAYKKLKR